MCQERAFINLNLKPQVFGRYEPTKICFRKVRIGKRMWMLEKKLEFAMLRRYIMNIILY